MSKSLLDEINSLVSGTTAPAPDSEPFDSVVRVDDFDESVDVGAGALRTKMAEPELDEAFQGKVVNREDLDDWGSLPDSEGDEDEDVSEGSEDDEDEESNRKNSKKTSSVIEAERLRNALLLEGDSKASGKKKIKKEFSLFEDVSSYNPEEKTESAKAQVKLYDSAMETRIRMQPLVTNANRLPQKELFDRFMSSSSDTEKRLVAAQHAARDLFSEIDDLAVALWNQNEEIVRQCGQAAVAYDEDNSEDDLESIWNRLQERHGRRQQWCDETLDKWAQRTQIGFAANRKFKAVALSATAQIEQVLQDKKRLLRRTQQKRGEGSVFGASAVKRVRGEDPELEPEEELAPSSKKNKETLEIDEEIFDDTDFYGELLRELIESHSSSDAAEDAAAAAELQNVRKATKKKRSNTQISKGRTLRYDVIPELVNFMTPVYESTREVTWDPAQLFANLFGGIGSTKQ